MSWSLPIVGTWFGGTPRRTLRAVSRSHVAPPNQSHSLFTLGHLTSRCTHSHAAMRWQWDARVEGCDAVDELVLPSEWLGGGGHTAGLCFFMAFGFSLTQLRAPLPNCAVVGLGLRPTHRVRKAFIDPSGYHILVGICDRRWAVELLAWPDLLSPPPSPIPTTTPMCARPGYCKWCRWVSDLLHTPHGGNCTRHSKHEGTTTGHRCVVGHWRGLDWGACVRVHGHVRAWTCLCVVPHCFSHLLFSAWRLAPVSNSLPSPSPVFACAAHVRVLNPFPIHVRALTSSPWPGTAPWWTLPLPAPS